MKNLLVVLVVLFAVVPAKAEQIVCSLAHGGPVTLGVRGTPAEQVERAYGPVIVGTPENARLEEIARMMGYKGSIKLLASKEVNALVIPGGQVYFTRGILEFADKKFNDRQTADLALAGVLGHEMVHHEKNHFRRATFGKSLEWRAAVGGAIGVLTARNGDEVRSGLSWLAVGNHFDRNEKIKEGEAEADELAVKKLNEKNITALPFADLLEGLQQVSPTSRNFFARALSDHPDHRVRAGRVRKRNLVQAPLREVGPIGPILVVVENRLRYYGSSGFYIWTRNRRIHDGYDDPSAVVAPAVIDALVKQGFDVVENDRIDTVIRELDARLTGRFDESTLAEAGRLVGASHILVIALTDDAVNSTGNFEIRTGRFGGHRAEGEVAQRRLKMAARLVEVQTRIIPWTSSKMGTEAALVGSYRNFGFFNGAGAEAGHAQQGRAVKSAVEKIAAALRRDVSPAPEKTASAESHTPPAVHTAGQEEKPDRSNSKQLEVVFDSGSRVFVGGLWWIVRAGEKVGEVRVLSLEALPDGRQKARIKVLSGSPQNGDRLESKD